MIQGTWNTVGIVTLLTSIILSGCTGGRITKNGDPVPNAEVEIRTCESTHFGDADSQGYFTFNPYSSNSVNTDDSQFIPPGPIAIVVLPPGGLLPSVVRKNHQYDSTCSMLVNNVKDDVPCKFHYVAMKDMSASEFYDEIDAFAQKDCRAESISVDRSKIFSKENYLPSNLTGKPRASGCLSNCADTCMQNESFDQMQYCMCSCVESSCGSTFGPYCAKTSK